MDTSSSYLLLSSCLPNSTPMTDLLIESPICKIFATVPSTQEFFKIWAKLDLFLIIFRPLLITKTHRVQNLTIYKRRWSA